MISNINADARLRDLVIIASSQPKRVTTHQSHAQHRARSAFTRNGVDAETVGHQLLRTSLYAARRAFFNASRAIRIFSGRAPASGWPRRLRRKSESRSSRAMRSPFFIGVLSRAEQAPCTSVPCNRPCDPALVARAAAVGVVRTATGLRAIPEYRHRSYALLPDRALSRKSITNSRPSNQRKTLTSELMR